MRIVFAAVGFIGGNADMVQGILLFFQPVDLFCDKVGFELAGTPAHPHPGPTIASRRLTHSNTALYGPLLLLGNIEHEPFKTVGMPQGGNVQSSLPKKKSIQLCQMLHHLRELHARIGVEYAVDGQALFDHQNQKTRAVFST